MANTIQNSSSLPESSDPEVKLSEGTANAVEASSSVVNSSSNSITHNGFDSNRPPTNISRPTAAPHPKKYSAFNINKKFLEKTSGSSLAAPASSHFNSSKIGARPPIQPSSSHPRLVTTKLTATAQLSPSPGPGWSRPSSVTPPAPSSVPNGAPTPSQAAAAANSSSSASQVAPQLPHVGKVIQPQPRSVVQANMQKEGGGGQTSGSSRSGSVGKPAWGNSNAVGGPPGATRADPRTQNDFPTAAEVAQAGRKQKLPREKGSEMVDANKQARMEEADTFRGVHLDPNAHHWDEMEEDDDNFLDGVLDFGDGRQYKIDANTDSAPSDSSPPQASSRLEFSHDLEISEPVSKEERFADDFDRSWPRNKGATPSEYSHSSTSRGPNNISPSTSHSAQSPLESYSSSRVLFNERSNRLEPYNKDSGRPVQGDSRFVRNYASATTSSSNNVQLLQKPPLGEGSHRARGYSGANERQMREPQRDGPPVQQHQQLPHRSPWLGPAVPLPSSPSFERDPPPDHRGRRLSNMGPPPVHSHTLNRAANFKDNGRQLPPHLPSSHPAPPIAPPFERRQSSRESRFSARPPSSTGHSSHPSESPVLLHSAASITATSPVVSHTLEVSSSSVSQLSTAELDEVKKDLMSTAAARAKQRRQQEEEEREREKERARIKAAELEARMSAQKAERERMEQEKAEKERTEKEKAQEEEKAAEQAKASTSQSTSATASKDPQVAAIIQEAVSTVQHSVNGATFGKPPLPRLSSVKAPVAPVQDSSHPPFSRKPSLFGPPTPSAPSGTVESWRSKTQPASQSHDPIPAQVQTQFSPVSERPRAMSFATPPPSALDQVQSITDLEIVDYSDLAKFVEVEKSESEVASDKPETTKSRALSPTKARRPVASDFFEDEPSERPSKSDARPTSAIAPSLSSTRSPSIAIPPRESKPPNDATSLPPKPAVPEVVVSVPTKPSFSAVPMTADTSVSAVKQTPTSPAAARRNHYKEAAMSALDDAMSRIKGALDVMHETKPPVLPSLSPSLSLPSSKPDRWVPPALRERSSEPKPTEVFATTRSELSSSPTSAWNVFTVNLPKASIPRPPISRRQIAAFNKQPTLRWDVISFVHTPLIRRDLLINDVLFGKPSVFGGKGKIKYQVSLPKSVVNVNIPTSSQALPTRLTSGAFGKPTVADDAQTWRKPMQSVKEEELTESVDSVGLDTTSRSPPPEPEPISKETLTTENEDVDVSSSSRLLRARSSPRMPAGSGVAFYRNAQVVNTESGSKPSVSFFATNELEIPSKAVLEDTQKIPAVQDFVLSTTEPTPLSSSSAVVKPAPVKTSPSSSQYGLPALIHSGKTESKSSEDSPDRVPLTPPAHHSSPWAPSSLGLSVKEPPVRGPDPEHLKAVWSQTSHQPGLHPVNSLDGITDDLPSVSFTIQDVKSEDGETPPSTSAAPSRMSLHDVTRAFQQVPSSSGMVPHRPTISPPSTTAPVARPTPATTTPAYSYHPPPVQPQNQTARPQYPFHPSPMMSHSPAPGPMYSHPNPMPQNRIQVNGHVPPLYSPVWMPLQNPNTQNSPMMRPMSTSFPTPPLMPYHPSPNAPHPIYPLPPPPPNMPPPTQQNGASNRGRTTSMMSPVVPHAMYPGSPAMMPVHAGRGAAAPGRNDGSHHHHHPHAPLPQHHHPAPPQPQPYPTTGPFAGSRPSW